jgi:hypothetical protein
MFSNEYVGSDLSLLNTGSGLHLCVPLETSRTLDFPFCSPDLTVHLEWCCLSHVHVSEHCSVNIYIFTVCTNRVPTSELVLFGKVSVSGLLLRTDTSHLSLPWWSTLWARCPVPLLVTSLSSSRHLTAHLLLVSRLPRWQSCSEESS